MYYLNECIVILYQHYYVMEYNFLLIMYMITYFF